MEHEFDCVVLGGGPGGYVAAIRAAQNKLRTAIVEQQDLGGTCLNRGCIPSKALIASASAYKTILSANDFGIHVDNAQVDFGSITQRKDRIVSSIRQGLTQLIRSNKITVFSGIGKLQSPTQIKVSSNEPTLINTKHIVLATGSEPRPLPQYPFSSRILCSTGILSLTSLPKKLAIIGGGVIGCEFASLFRTFGTEVTILEAAPNILAINPKISQFITDSFRQRGIQVLTQTQIHKIDETQDQVTIHYNDTQESFEYVLVSIGRSLNTSHIGLDVAGIAATPQGIIPTNDQMQTNIPNVYAIGDITGKWMLAHVASHQGLVAADHIAGHRASMDYSAIPSVVFTAPEIAVVGLSLDDASKQGFDAQETIFPLKAIGKAVAMNDANGFSAIISDKQTQQVLGGYIIGPHASSLIGELAIAVRNELTLPSIYETIHAHPTLAEVWLENALLAAGQPVHMPPTSR